MKSFIEKEFDYLSPVPSSNKEEPRSRTIGINEMARIVSKKTKFRVIDCEEVIKEFCNAAFVELAKRNSINMNGLFIRNQWVKNKKPVFIFEDEENNIGYWSYGNWYPNIEMDTQHKKAFIGKWFKLSESIMDEIGQYLPEEVDSYDKYIEYINNIIKEEVQKNKNLIVTEDNYIIGPRGGKKRFISDFHPTKKERQKYVYNKNMIRKEYLERINNGEDLPKTWIYDRLKEVGFETINDKYGGDVNDG